MGKIWNEVAIDFEKDGVTPIKAWLTEDESFEEGKVIANINYDKREVIYIDERAKTDFDTQNIILNFFDDKDDKKVSALFDQLKKINENKIRHFNRYRDHEQKYITIDEIIRRWKLVEPIIDWFNAEFVE